MEPIDENHPPGHVTVERTMWCGICARWDQESADKKGYFVRLMMNRGWKRVKRRGWICPDCARRTET